MNLSLTAIPGIKVGHATAQGTGCTAILCPQGMVPGVAAPGLAPGSRETDMMRARSSVEEIHGICLSGGSCMGLAAASGVARWLAQQGYGFATPRARLPIVPAAVIYDLFSNQAPGILPDEHMGYQAAQSADRSPVASGAYGAGAGAHCGMLAGQLSRAGLGSAGLQYGSVIAAALVVNNALGNIYDPDSGAFVAGAVDEKGRPLGDEAIMEYLNNDVPAPVRNTTLVVVATNAGLSKIAANRLAGMAYGGVSTTVRPSGLMLDGDMVFALGCKNGPTINENLLGYMAAKAVSAALLNSVRLPPK